MLLFFIPDTHLFPHQVLHSAPRRSFLLAKKLLHYCPQQQKENMTSGLKIQCDPHFLLNLWTNHTHLTNFNDIPNGAKLETRDVWGHDPSFRTVIIRQDQAWLGYHWETQRLQKKKKKKRKKWSWKLRCKNKANIWELVWQPNISQVLGDTHKVKIQLVLSDGIFLPRNVWSVSSTQVVKHFCTQNIKDVTRLLTVNKVCRARSFFTILPMQAFCDIHMPFTKNL